MGSEDRRTISRRHALKGGAMLLAASLAGSKAAAQDEPFAIEEGADRISIAGEALEAAVATRGYVSGAAGGSLLDKKSGFRDAGFGLDVVDWIMEPGSDAAYRKELAGDLRYEYDNLVHGKRAKRCIEGPQICTGAKEVTPEVIRGKDFVAFRTRFRYTIAAPGKKAGSLWEQTLVFPAGKRYFLAADRITPVNASDCQFLRIDMPGHIKHRGGDSFSEVYLSYRGRIPAREFTADFPPDAKFDYRRDRNPVPQRFIRAYRRRDPRTGRDGPWLAGMTLAPADVYEAWCHQRGYVCMIQEIGGWAVRPGQSYGAAYAVGFFDSIEEMERVCDQYAGHSGLEASERGWRLVRRESSSG